jgi:hypothetical protein
LEWLRGGLLAAAGMTMQALPVELLTPVVRVVRGRHGVQLGPTAAALLIPVINVSASRRALSRSVPQGSRPGRALDVVALALPTLAAGTPATVVLRARSPLWAWGVAAAIRVLIGVLLGLRMDRNVRRYRRAAERTAAGPHLRASSRSASRR